MIILRSFRDASCFGRADESQPIFLDVHTRSSQRTSRWSSAGLHQLRRSGRTRSA